MGVNLVGTPSYATTEAAGYVVGSCQYLLLLEYNNSGACGNYNAFDTLFGVAYNNGANNNNGIYASIGLSTNGTDGQHHRAFIKATRDVANTSATYAGRLTLGTRDTSGGYTEVLHATSCARVGIGTCTPNAKLQILSNSAALVSTATGATNSTYARFENTTDGLAAYFGLDGGGLVGADNGSALVGSSTNKSIIIAPGLAEKMRITGGGYVGIGTSTPCTVLSVTTGGGSYNAPDCTNVSNIYVFNSNSTCTTAHSMLTLRTNDAGGGNPFISFDINQVTGWAMGIDNADSDKFKLGWGWSSVSANTALTVTTATLRVGIGTTSPSERLVVCGAQGQIQSRVDSSDGSTINVRPNAGRCGWISYTEDAVADRWGIGIKNGDAKLYFSSGNVGIAGGTTRMVLDGSGNLGVGTSSPCTLLMIKGGASSTKTDLLSISTCAGAGTQPTLRFDTIEANTNVLGRISVCDLSFFSSAMIFETSGCKATGDTATTERMRIVGTTGNVGIATTAPSYRLHVNGTFYAAGSSIDYKEGICQYDTNSCLFMCLKPKTYQYKDEWKHLGKELKSETQIGLIAEEVAEVMPELAILVEEDNNKVVRNVDYEKLSIILLSEVQKLRKEVDQLKQSC